MLTKSVEYHYDVFDRRIAKLVDSDGLNGTDRGETYVYDADPAKGGLDDVVLSFDLSGDLQRRYLHGPNIDEVFADEDALNEILWSLADRQGSVERWVEYDDSTQTASVAVTVTFDAYGNITDQTPGTAVFYAYTGRTWDADTETYDYRARVYDAHAGSFLSEDPIGFAGGQANLSAYVGNSPTNATDPSGLDRRAVFAGHSWIVVDTWDSAGKKTGQAELHFAPGGYTVNPYGTCPYPEFITGT